MRNTSTWAPSAPSPTIWPREAWHWFLTPLTLVAALAIMIVVAFVYQIATISSHVLTLQQWQTGTVPAVHQVLLQGIAWIPVYVFLLAVMPALSRTSLRDLGFRMPTNREIGIGLGGAIAMLIVVNGSASVIAAVTHRHDTEAAVALLNQSKTPFGRFIFILLGVVFAPLGEELVFRGYLFNAITRYVGPAAAKVPVAAILSGALFGLAHMSKADPWDLLTLALPLALGGVLLAYVYAETKCFWVNFTTHATFNLIGVALMFAFPQAK